MESRKAVDRDQAERRCREHLTMIDWFLGGQQEAVADFLGQHLRNAAHRTATGATHPPPLGAQEAYAGAAAWGREAPDRARRSEIRRRPAEAVPNSAVRKGAASAIASRYGFNRSRRPEMHRPKPWLQGATPP
ncbi:hypothethical protein (plasmid) [Ralstonia solanacearum CMR15]|nr:hypothethical protein [Ralstonia solanacearum CMR15]